MVSLSTSATLTDRGETGPEWDSAIARSGAAWLDAEPKMTAAESPFDYASRAEVLIVTDIKKGDLPALAGSIQLLGRHPRYDAMNF